MTIMCYENPQKWLYWLAFNVPVISFSSLLICLVPLSIGFRQLCELETLIERGREQLEMNQLNAAIHTYIAYLDSIDKILHQPHKVSHKSSNALH